MFCIGGVNITSRIVVDSESGEILAELKDGDRLKITRVESIEQLKKISNADSKQQDITINTAEPFVKVYSKALTELAKSLTGAESQFINYLVQYIRYRSGILAHSNGITLTRLDMALEMGLSLKTIDKLLQSLIDKQIIGKHKTGHDIKFTVNPFIFMRGDKVNETLYMFYRNTRWARGSNSNG